MRVTISDTPMGHAGDHPREMIWGPQALHVILGEQHETLCEQLLEN